MIIGVILGMSRFIAEYVHPTPACNEVDDRPLFASMNFMYFGKYQEWLGENGNYVHPGPVRRG